MNSLFTTRGRAISATIVVIALIVPAFVGSATAQEAGASGGPTDPAELGAFLDELLTNNLREYHIAGAAVSVVKDGRLFVARGYGFADVDNGIPVDPEQTIFRIGSVGKVFTWTAVMQLVDEGKLDLDTDINEYLDFRIPENYPQPVTLRHLLTHTSGFEDWLVEAAVTDASDLVPAREWLTSHMAARVRPPGESAGYSNYNAVLAGYIVGRVSGQSYDEYIQDRILDPLGMLHSTARSQMPSDLREHRSVGYTYVDGGFQAFPGYMAQPAAVPSGGLQASVTDMARFMIAHLQGGRYSDAHTPEVRILNESTMQQMHSTLYTPDPRLLGTAYGLFDMSDNGQRTLGHTGYSPPMHSMLLLLPEQNLGLFVAYNTRGAGELTAQHVGFQRAFFDRYYPAPDIEPAPPPADFTQRAGRFVGSYRYISSPSTSLAKIGALFGYTAVISDPGDGMLVSTIEGFDYRFVEIEPLYFRQADGPFGMVFREDERGRITEMATDLMPQYAAVKLGWYETPGFHMLLLQGFVLVFASILPVSLIRALRNRRGVSHAKPALRGERVWTGTILTISVLNLIVVAGTFLWVMRPSELHTPMLIYQVVLGLGVLSTVLTLGALGYTAVAWKNGYWGVTTRVYHTLVIVAAVAFVWFLDYWNLLGWRY
jgi:CubicO group peptidase (beta-lactamase class C family)